MERQRSQCAADVFNTYAHTHSYMLTDLLLHAHTIRAAFEREKEFVARYHGELSDIVRLNIGGERTVEVPRQTLVSDPDSMLAAMFSGRHKVPLYARFCPRVLSRTFHVLECALNESSPLPPSSHTHTHTNTNIHTCRLTHAQTPTRPAKIRLLSALVS